MQVGDFFVEFLAQGVDADFGAAFVEVDLGENLVGEGVRHHERGVACGAAEVDQAAFPRRPGNLIQTAE